MARVCSDQDRLFYEKKALLDLHMPPRKLLQHRNLSIFLPEEITKHQEADGRHGIDDDGDEPEEEEKATDEEVNVYSSDEFRMYEFKVRRCMRGRSHDWTDCPFAHPGEKARRRDPRRHHYSGAVCPDFRRTGCCPRGDACELAHGVFECWLHPARYRTMPCKDGRRCRRKVCFFAHSPRQLRVLPSHTNSASSPPQSPRVKNPPPNYDALWSAATKASVLSPTSPLLNFSSPPASPPISPSVADHYQLSCLSSKRRNAFGSYGYKESESMFPGYGVMGYDALYEELIHSLDAMEIAASSSSSPLPSPATKISSHLRANEFRDLALMEQSSSSSSKNNNNGGGGGGPDLDWVNELLM